MPMMLLWLGALIGLVDVRVNELTSWAVRSIFMVSRLQRRAFDKLILDLESSVSETCGRRERWSSAAADASASELLVVRCSDLLGGVTIADHSSKRSA